MKVSALEDFTYLKIEPTQDSETIFSERNKQLEEMAFPREDYTPSQFIIDTSVEVDISGKLWTIIPYCRRGILYSEKAVPQTRSLSDSFGVDSQQYQGNLRRKLPLPGLEESGKGLLRVSLM